MTDAEHYNSDHDPIVVTVAVAGRGGKQGFNYRMIHASGDTFMKVTKTRSDVRNLLTHGAMLITLTEMGDATTVKAVREVVKNNGDDYKVINPDDGDILFLLHHDARLLASGGPLAIPAKAGPARLGGHGPRRNSWLRFGLHGETITHTGCHFVTRVADHKTMTGNREDEQLKQARLMGEQMVGFGRRAALATGSGDLNSMLPNNKDMQAVFDKYHLTTTAEETQVMTGTHGHARIDYVWTYDRDVRVKVTHMKVLKG